MQCAADQLRGAVRLTQEVQALTEAEMTFWQPVDCTGDGDYLSVCQWEAEEPLNGSRSMGLARSRDGSDAAKSNTDGQSR